MNNESKETIKTIFANFDKDKSNFIDIKEIALVAKELGEVISEEEMTRIFKDLDINKDGRISFEEFWDWWTYGRANKLERFVFMKLKAMNLLKKAHANFVRYGASLESKFDSVMDHHYLALNMGVPVPETALSARVFLRGEENAQFQTLSKGLTLNNDFIGLILRFESSNPAEAKTELDRIFGVIKEEGGKAGIEYQAILPFVNFSSGIDEKCALASIEVKHPFFEDMVEKFKSEFLRKFGEDFKVIFSAEFGLKNSLRKLIDNMAQKFVGFFFEGFIGEAKLSINSSLLKTLRGAGLQYLMELANKNKLSNWGVLLSLIQGSKFHLVFREVEDVNKFFKGMGVDSLLDSQPSSKDILDELKKDFWIPSMKNNPIIMGLINFCQKHVIAHVSINLRLPQTIGTLELNTNGVKEFVNYMLSD